jgi:hypothetical protein
MKTKVIVVILSFIFISGCKTPNALITNYDINKLHYTSELEVTNRYFDKNYDQLKIYNISDKINGETYTYSLLIPKSSEGSFIIPHGFPLKKAEVNSLYESLTNLKVAISERKEQYKQYKFTSCNMNNYLFVEGQIINEDFQVKIVFSSLNKEKNELMNLSNYEDSKGNSLSSLDYLFAASSINSYFIIEDIEELDGLINLLSMAN